MAKIWTILLMALAIMGAPWHGADAGEHEADPHSLPPMSEALHAVVEQAEKVGSQGDASGAAAVLTEYLHAHPEETHPYPCYDAAFFLHQAGKGDAALTYVQKALTLNPSFAEAWQLLASLQLEAGKTGAAAEALEKAAAITRIPEAWYQTAVLYLDAGRPEKGLSCLNKVPPDQPKTADWHVAAARAHQELKDLPRAAEAMASAHALSKDPEHLYQSALFWLEAEQPGKALPPLKTLTDKGPAPSHWLVALSQALKALKKKEETAEAMERAAERGRDPNLWFHAAWLWLEADHPRRARALLEKLAGRKDTRVEWLVALANTYMILDQDRSAAMTMDRVVKMDPQPEYLYNAGVLWLQAERPDKALPHLLALCTRSPAKAEWFVALAHAWMGKKDVKKAATAMEQAAAISNDPEHAYQAGLMWIHAGQADAALRLLLPLRKTPSPRAEWLAAVSNAWVLKEAYEDAAEAMEAAAHISRKPDHVYAAAGLWLHADKAQKALPLLKGLAQLPGPKAEWLVLLSETYLRLKEVDRAAGTMEQAARVSGKPEHLFRAARLWLEADQPDRARPLLEGLVGRPSPKGEWYAALSTCCLMLGEPEEAARYMEKAARITQKGEDYYRAGMLWLQVEDSQRGIALLEVCAALNPVEQKWLVGLAQALVSADREEDALGVMERTTLSDLKTSGPAIAYQGALLWLHLKRPGQALPVLKALCASRSPKANWLADLVKTHVELDQMNDAERVLKRLIDLYPRDLGTWRLAVWIGLQQNDYAKAAAAMAVAARLGPPDPDLLTELADLHHMAGAPVKAARTLEKAWKGHPPSPQDWDRLVAIYLSGHRYEPALACARSAVDAEATAKRWETIGTITFRLRRFEDSLDAYLRSADLTPGADVRLKAGHAALRLDRLDEAARLFEEAMGRAGKNSRIAYEAHRGLAYIRKIRGEDGEG
jgi:tetratricopeptide (TPR) repeat protein